MNNKKTPFEHLPTVDHFSREDRGDQKKWTGYEIVDSKLYSENVDYTGAKAQTVRFQLQDYGLLNKLVLKMVVRFDDDGGDASDDARYPALQLLKSARLLCGEVEIYALEGPTIEAIIQQSSPGDQDIMQEALPEHLNVSDDSNGDKHTLYVPLPFGCFDKIDRLLDPEYLQPLVVEVQLRRIEDVLENNSDAFSFSELLLLAQYLELEDYPAFYKKRYSKPYFFFLTNDYFHEPHFTFAGTKDVKYTSPRIRLKCDRSVSQTFLYVRSDGVQGRYMNPSVIDSVTVYDGDQILRFSNSDLEHLLLHHTEYRLEEHLKDNTNASDSYVHVLNWGMRSDTDMSNHKQMKDENLWIEFTCTPSSTNSYVLHISHDYYKRLSFDQAGRVRMIEY